MARPIKTLNIKAQVIRPTVLTPANEQLALMYLSKKRGRGLFTEPKQLGNLTSKIIPSAKNIKSRNLDYLCQNWGDIVGEKLAKITSPETISGKSLVLRINGAAAPLIEMRNKEILGLAGLAIGFSFTKLKLIQAPNAKPKNAKKEPPPLDAQKSAKLEENLANIPSQRLKNALRLLNRYIQN